MTPTFPQTGYWLVGGDGGVFSYGAPFYGSAGAVHLNQPVVGMAATPDAGGYYLVAADGGVFTYGDARFHGSVAGVHLNRPIVGMAVDPATGGYWLVAADGGVFSFDTPFYGSAGAVHLSQPVVGMAASPDGGGYYLVAADGGVFTYGDADFQGSSAATPDVSVTAGIGVAADGSGGYWESDAAGLVSAFAEQNFGSVRAPLTKPVIAIGATPFENGYYLVAADGGVFTFGNAPFRGSAGDIALDAPIVGMAVYAPPVDSPVPVIATTELPDGVMDHPYRTALHAAGGTGPYSWKVTSGNLPTGLALNLAGLITGTPTADQISNFAVTVDDDHGNSASEMLTLGVLAQDGDD
jgi:hypothetical protein